MNIGFDAKRAFCNKTGLGHYSRNLISNFIRYQPENHYFLYTPYKKLTSFDEILNQKNVIERSPIQFTDKLFPSLWRSGSIKKQIYADQIDLYHGLSHEIPFGLNSLSPNKKIKKVVTMHDLIYLRYPEYFSSMDRLAFDIKYRYACHNSDHIIAVSQQTKQDLIDYYQVEETKISVIYQNCGSHFFRLWSESERNDLKQKFKLTQPFALFVGTIEPRKNVYQLVRAFALLPRDLNVQLILVGSGKKYKSTLVQFIKENDLEDRIRFLGYVTDNDMPGLYQSAQLFIYPAFFEGFGIPLVEALHSRVPIITTMSNPFAEIVKDAALLVNPQSEIEMRDALKKLITQSSLRQDLINRGIKRCPLFAPQELTRQIMQVYHSLL